jgi:hypothetical protein
VETRQMTGIHELPQIFTVPIHDTETCAH